MMIDNLSDFYGPNAGYVLELYERFQQDANSVDPPTRALFERWTPPSSDGGAATAPTGIAPAELPALADKIAGVARLARYIRSYGHLAAHLDPLGTPPPDDPTLYPQFWGLTEEDLAELPANIILGPLAQGAQTALQVVQALWRVYCATTGYDYDHVHEPQERDWLRDAAESGRFAPPHEPIDEQALLARLTEVEAFERFLGRTFPGRTRFSVEGVDTLIPILDEMIQCAAESTTRTVLIGMAHRGRLNVLTHVLHKPYADILAEFHTPAPRPNTSASESSDEGYAGDVKYHLGHRRAYDNPAGTNGARDVEMTVRLVPNPSHLEYVDPVVVGMARAAQGRRDQRGAPVQDEKAAFSILIHGDAAFPGQGVVAETLNLSRLPGYRTGGTIHIITNNQLGFTATEAATRSTLYASDLAKGFEIPIIHVNADDPVACVAAARLAYAYCDAFEKDFLIDLVGYRRFGHNEGDDPTFTQPVMYEKINSHPTVRELFARHLGERGVIQPGEAEAMVMAATEQLRNIWDAVRHGSHVAHEEQNIPETRQGPIETAVSLAKLAELNQQLHTFPDGFTLNPKLDRPMQRRRSAFDQPDGKTTPEGGVDWAHAETLAFASILSDGTPIRLTGQDVERGTFSQRHLVFHDFKTGETFAPLRELPAARASFEVLDSPLSESAPVGFEYGYSVEAPETLVLWEAQYGDFANSAQVMIDNFVVSARVKWQQRPSLVLLLPHGYEGQGPEHSSGRLERFLELAAQGNLRIANCTTAAQYFHLLRRQAALLALDPRPLVVMTPKSLLRHPLARSPIEALASGRFQYVFDDPRFADEDSEAQPSREDVARLILCSGKIYVDLVASERYATSNNIAIARVEQLYPFPGKEIAETVSGYRQLREVLWVQEEPQNMGAWSFVEPRLREWLAPDLPMRYVGRPRSASPSEGLPEWHAHEQARIVNEALSIETKDERRKTDREADSSFVLRPSSSAEVQHA